MSDTNGSGHPVGLAAPIRWDNAPAELAALPRWIVARRKDSIKADGTPRVEKVPAHPETGQTHDKTDPAIWMTMERASALVPPFDYAGVVVMEGDGLVGFDLDDCFDA